MNKFFVVMTLLGSLSASAAVKEYDCFAEVEKNPASTLLYNLMVNVTESTFDYALFEQRPAAHLFPHFFKNGKAEEQSIESPFLIKYDLVTSNSGKVATFYVNHYTESYYLVTKDQTRVELECRLK